MLLQERRYFVEHVGVLPSGRQSERFAEYPAPAGAGELSAFMGSAYCVADEVVWEFAEPGGRPQFRLKPESLESSVSKVLAGFSFREGFYSLALTTTG